MRGPSRDRTVVILTIALAAGLLVVSLPARSGAIGRDGPSTRGTDGSFWSATPSDGAWAWDNGVVSLRFPSANPSFTLSSVSDPRVVTEARLGGVAEVAPNGSSRAFAPFVSESVPWTYSALSSGGMLIVRLAANVTLWPSAGEWEQGDDVGEGGTPLGVAAVNATFYLGNATGSGSNALRFTVNVTWPWLDANDSLGFELRMFALGPTSIAAGSSGTSLSELRKGSSALVASLSWSPTAAVHYVNGTDGNSSVGTARFYSTAYNNSTVRLLFGSVAGGYTSLAYDPSVLLNLSAFGPLPLAAWALTIASEAVLGGAVALTALLAAVAIRWRRTDPVEP